MEKLKVFYSSSCAATLEYLELSDSVSDINLIVPSELAMTSINKDFIRYNFVIVGNNIHMPDISISEFQSIFSDIFPDPYKLELV